MEMNLMINKIYEMLLLNHEMFYKIISVMFGIAGLVFATLFFVDAGYGKLNKNSQFWGITIPNKIGWVIMEAPSFLISILFYMKSNEERKYKKEIIACLLPFAMHYFQRSFIFPLLIKGRGRMPIAVMMMGFVFNVINSTLQCNWLYNISNVHYYDGLFSKFRFYLGLMIFVIGMFINIQSDHIIRTLRKPGDNKHYLPDRGMYRYITSANYFGEIVEWFGYSIMTNSLTSILFVIWTAANLVPRSFSIYNLYISEFGNIVLTKKRIIPFII